MPHKDNMKKNGKYSLSSFKLSRKLYFFDKCRINNTSANPKGHPVNTIHIRYSGAGKPEYIQAAPNKTPKIEKIIIATL